jgi:hypothetical protein
MKNMLTFSFNNFKSNRGKKIDCVSIEKNPN